MIYVDAPIWPAHGTAFAHVASDASYAELHAFAARVGLDPRTWDGGHDVPLRRYDDVVAAGATVVDGRTMTRLLAASGLRFRKRRGERPLAALHDVVPGLATPHRVDVLRSATPAPDATTVGAFVVVADARDRVLLVRPARRGGWEVPGGMREPGESVAEGAAREVAEETGVALDAASLAAFGYEPLVLPRPTGRWPLAVNHVQGLAATLPGEGPVPVPRAGEILDAAWVPSAEVADRCAGAFWWPLLADRLGLAHRRH